MTTATTRTDNHSNNQNECDNNQHEHNDNQHKCENDHEHI